MRISARRVGELVRKELRQIFRDPRLKRIVFVSPVVQLVLFGYAVNTDVRNTALFVVDHDHTARSRSLVETLTAGGYFQLVGQSNSAADLARALDRGHAVVGLEIPSGFARDLGAGGAAVQLLVDGTDSNTGLVAQGHAVQILQRYGIPPAGSADRRPAVDLRARAWYNPELASQVYNVPAVIGILLLLMCLLLTALTVVREREVGTLEQLMVSPLSPSELMLGKTVPVALIALVDLVLVTAIAMLWFGIPMRGSAAALALAAALYILAGLAVGLLISTISRTQQEAFMTMFLFVLPAIILSGFMYPVETMPEVFQWLTLLNPVRHFLEVVRGIFLKGEGVIALWRQYVVLAVMAAGTLWLAAGRFHKSIG